MTDNGLSLPPTEGYQGACSLPTLPGFVIFGALGAAASGRRDRVEGAVNGIFGGWLGCALARAMGVRTEGASALITMAGAYWVARISRR